MRLNELGDMDLDVGTIEKEKEQGEPPKRYHVVLLNDDYTPAEFVVYMLTKFFKLSPDAAFQAMLDVHQKGEGIVDTFPKDVAETRARQASEHAGRQGHPLRFVTKPE